MKVLAIVAHPDDAECYCAGTLLKCVSRGDEVTICHVCNGCLGHVEIPPEKLIEIRKEEAQTAGKLAGVKVLSANVNDLELFESDKKIREKLVGIIRSVNPDFIITHYPNDYMPDHIAVSKLAFDASYAASIPQYKQSENKPIKNIPLYYMEPDSGLNFNPTIYVDITDVFDKKIQMLSCHKSQVEWIEEHDGLDFSDSIKTTAKNRGNQCGVEFAEGFIECNVALKVKAKRLLP